ncbi:MAG: copper homeostasis protein CutC [Bacilli bacterium]
MSSKIIVELCCGSISDVVKGIEAKVSRIELNSALELGGLSCTTTTLQKALTLSSIPIVCMVRPRKAGFNYTQEEFLLMLEEAKTLIKLGASGIVFGFLNEDGQINKERTKAMVDVIKPQEAIFHKAIDATNNIEESIKILIECGVNRVLTGGGSIYPHLDEAYPLLRHLIKKYAHQIEILPGGGITSSNITSLLKETKTKQVHFSAKEYVLDSSTSHYNTNDKDSLEHQYLSVSQSKLQELIQIIDDYTKNDNE